MPTSPSNKKIIGITLGDPGGVGPEVTFKALASPLVRKAVRESGQDIAFVLLGNGDIYEENRRLTNSKLVTQYVPCVDSALLSSKKINILDLQDSAHEVQVGKVSIANAVLSYHSLEVATYLALHGIIDAMVTAPINKEAVQLISPQFTGHTEYLATMAKVKKHAMLIQGGGIRTVFVTTHVPLMKVGEHLTQKKIIEKTELLFSFLKSQLNIRKPVIAVAALNPHAGEGGKMGREEIDIIAPAVKKARKKGISVDGPLPSDIVFHAAYHGNYDGVVCMYHDQGLGPLKMLALHSGVNITLNLPFVRTSPDHGTAFDIAYTNNADPGSMIESIKTAIQMIS